MRETLSWRKASVGVAAFAMCFTLFGATSPAHAHQPVQLTAAERTPARGPLLVDGTVSFAVYASVGQGQPRGFRVGMKSGERLEVQLLIPDQAPVNQLAASALPVVTIIDPAGKRTALPITERTEFFEPYSNTKYLYLARLNGLSMKGVYKVVVTGKSSTVVPVVVGVGYREVPGKVIP
jgi:hypothetical protein